jgi:hypothetical protein
LLLASSVSIKNEKLKENMKKKNQKEKRKEIPTV